MGGGAAMFIALALPTQVTSDQNRWFNGTSDFLLFPLVFLQMLPFLFLKVFGGHSENVM
jgi:hypothetical protein